MSPDESLSRRDTGTEATSDPRRPWWPVGLALLGLVAVVLVGAVLLNRQFGPRVGVEPTPAVQTVAQGTAVPTPQSAPTAAAASTTAPATATPPAATATVPAVRVATSPLEREIEAAYQKYWDVRAEALYTLDPSRLPEVMAGAELERERQQIEELKVQGRAAKIDVEHRIAFVKVAETRAEIYDEYINKSYLVDAQTKQPIRTPGPGGIAKVSYQLQKIDGVWKVVDGTQHD